MHCHFGTCGAELVALKRSTGLPIVTTFYGADASSVPHEPGWRRRYQQLFACGDLFLAEGTTMVRSLVDLGCPSERVILHRLGVDLAALPFRVREPPVNGRVRILIAATFREKKGIPDALLAVREVLRMHPNLHVTLIGDRGGRPGDEAEKRRILHLLGGLGGIVEWRGFVTYEAFREALYSHHILLSPSRTGIDGDSEGGAPVSLIEAQASGMPIVSTLHADIPEIVLRDRSGLLSPEGDLGALVANLERVVRTNALWAPMGRAGRKHVEANHDLQRQVAHLEEHYATLMSGATP
jgi:colanic acid/amylovoran biosynthesis glycosyltransferase